MAIASVDWWCVPHIFQLDKAKIMDLPLLCFQHEKQKSFKDCWFFCVILVECTVCNKNLKPNQTPPRCWDLMPQVDSGPCKLHGRDNENWWKTALSSCIRGLTGQSVPKSKWQEMLFLTAQWQGGQAVAPHQQMPSIFDSMADLTCPTRQFLVTITPN